MGQPDAGIEYRDIDVDHALPVTRTRAAAIAVDAVDAVRENLVRLGLWWRNLVGCKDLGVLGEEEDSAVGFDGGACSPREPGGVAVQGVVVAVEDRRAVRAGVLGGDRSAVNAVLQDDDVLAGDDIGLGTTDEGHGEGESRQRT